LHGGILVGLAYKLEPILEAVLWEYEAVKSLSPLVEHFKLTELVFKAREKLRHLLIAGG